MVVQSVQKNISENVWLNYNRFRKTRTLGSKVDPSIEFKNITNDNNLGTNMKPDNCIWFSGGSWLFDDSEINENVFVIKNPKNILTITNLAELDKFIDKYFICQDIYLMKLRNYDCIQGLTFEKFYKILNRIVLNYQ